MASIKRLPPTDRRPKRRREDGHRQERRGKEAQTTQTVVLAISGLFAFCAPLHAQVVEVPPKRAPAQLQNTESPSSEEVSASEFSTLGDAGPLLRGPLRDDAAFSMVPVPSTDPSSKVLQNKLPLAGKAFQDPAADVLAASNRNWDSHSSQIPDYVQPSENELFTALLNETIGESNRNTLILADVIASVYRAYPVIQQARLLARSTAGEQLSASGAYDTKIEGYSLNQPIGFYQTYRQEINVARQLWWGGYISAGYRIGRGEFEPWYKERETNEGGEFKLALRQPILQGRAIDAERVELFQSNLRRQAVGPEVQENLLYASMEAANAYWNWIAAGITLRAQNDLLRLTEVRGEQLRQIMKAGQAKGNDLILNNQFIAERRLKVVESEQKLWQSASKLSLFLRDENGQPLVPATEWLPKNFAALESIPTTTLEEDYYSAVSRRPELQAVDLQIQQIRWDLQLANNQLLPNLDFTIQNKKDVGTPASSLGDKTPYELEAGLIGDVPIQRRKARGKIEQSIAKIEILQQKRRFQQDKISVELQNAQSGLFAAFESIRQAEAALAASKQSLSAYREAYRLNQVDLIVLNLIEPKVTENEIKLYEQQLKLFMSLAAKQAALGLDPLQQAISIPAFSDR